MWSILEKITNQVLNYSSSLGKVWYLLVFGYRLVVITSLGGSVYGDEQGQFQCSVKESGCENMCYNHFAKISHMRFWAFQLIAISTPTIFFHFYCLHVQSQIEKIKDTEKALEDFDGNDVVNTYDYKMEKDLKKLPRRRMQVGKYKMKKVYKEDGAKEVIHTDKIKVSYIISLALRFAMEVLFTHFGYNLFNIEDGSISEGSLFKYLWMRVPGRFKCGHLNSYDNAVQTACFQHLENQSGFVPCWVSRPYEKTVFLRYMNILSFICMLITALEIVQFIYRNASGYNKKNKQLKKHRLASEAPFAPPSFHEVMRRNTVFTNNIQPGRPMAKPLNSAPAGNPNFTCVSMEELDKQRSKERKKLLKLHQKDRSDNFSELSDVESYLHDDK